MNLFLDPKQPLATCSKERCNDCPHKGNLHCHFSGADLAKFLLAMAPPFVIGGIGVFRLQGWIVLIGWVLFFVSYFGLIEIRVMCSHCPHYHEIGHSLKCWANYGSPKLWRYRPGPMSTTEKIIFLGGLVVIFGLPVVIMVVHVKWVGLVIYSIALTIAFAYLRGKMCVQCINFACPLNRVDHKTRASFLLINPTIADAWKISKKN
jgi:hypothetical protein